jgi:hypothetical protein
MSAAFTSPEGRSAGSMREVTGSTLTDGRWPTRIGMQALITKCASE